MVPNFEWPTQEEVNAMGGDVRLRQIVLKVNDDETVNGICAAQVILKNGQKSPVFQCPQAKVSNTGSLTNPKSAQDSIAKVQAYCDQDGVYNVFLKGDDGAELSKFDPKFYGPIDSAKHRMSVDEELIGVYGHLDENQR